MKSKKKILITGGAGFLGSHLCEALLNQGHHVICLDNFFTGKKENISLFKDKENFEIFEHNICAPFFADVDEIYNLACPASPPHYQFDPVETTKTSVLGAINMLELAKKTGAKILQASTSEIYGDPLIHPQKESYFGNVNPIGPRACYDEGKRCAETLFFAYHTQHKVKIKIARIFNTYGPKMDCHDGRVVSNFIVQTLTGKPITIYGDGTQTRSFCFVTDLVEGLMRLMESGDSVTGPINLGNPIEMTINELVHHIESITGISAKRIFSNSPIDDPRKRKPDISLAKSFLKWEPKVSLTHGLEATIDYFKELLCYA